ncbi:hypothetical protein HPB51_029694 [Rhipicephalus microplus]|uniref:N-terminal Ras-GEF domain-containing protein n=1 Tax=Rhipicephalus microplus TaxID=6941 RepID=A0A9J6CTR7_RHIMP|nr:hypothetical protein HPB51_029694 [Rhipicephalus microplus]
MVGQWLRSCAASVFKFLPRKPDFSGQPSWRLWGEEKSDGAVYTVYLKKVRYHPSSSLSRHDSEDSVSHLEWETVRVRVIKAGPLEAIVANLADDEGGLEPTNVNVFLATYRSFSTPQQVLDAFQASKEFYVGVGLVSSVRSQHVGSTLTLRFDVGVAYSGVRFPTLPLHFGMSSPCFIHSSFLLMFPFVLGFHGLKLGLCTFATMSRQQSYTGDFKCQVILFTEDASNCAVQRKFCVNETLIRGWRKKRDRKCGGVLPFTAQ